MLLVLFVALHYTPEGSLQQRKFGSTIYARTMKLLLARVLEKVVGNGAGVGVCLLG